jgi:hypothetical protein
VLVDVDPACLHPVVGAVHDLHILAHRPRNHLPVERHVVDLTIHGLRIALARSAERLRMHRAHGEGQCQENDASPGPHEPTRLPQTVDDCRPRKADGSDGGLFRVAPLTRIRRMNQKCAAFLAIAAAGAFLFFAACGGGGDGGGNSSQSQPTTEPQQSQAGNQPGGGNPSQSSDTAALYVAIDLHSGGYFFTNGYGIGDGEQAGAGESLSTHTFHALLWRGSASSVVDLHPTGLFDGSAVNATSGGMQVGWGQHDDNTHHALKWAGSATSVVDLHPSGLFRYSEALGISGDQIVGWGEVPDAHALLWTRQGVVDLNPSGFSGSVAVATDGAQQVGNGTPPPCCNAHALLWLGSANSVVDLHPVSGYSSSGAYGVNGGQQVGEGWVGTLRHALLWTGSAQSVVDLHSSRFRETSAVGVAGGRQVGYGILADGSTRHALLWNGTPESVVDLHAFLPTGFARSEAVGIDASGNIIGSAADASGTSHAILWTRQ